MVKIVFDSGVRVRSIINSIWEGKLPERPQIPQWNPQFDEN